MKSRWKPEFSLKYILILQVTTDGKSARELFQELSPSELSELAKYYKDDLAIGGYSTNVF